VVLASLDAATKSDSEVATHAPLEAMQKLLTLLKTAAVSTTSSPALQEALYKVSVTCIRLLSSSTSSPVVLNGALGVLLPIGEVSPRVLLHAAAAKDTGKRIKYGSIVHGGIEDTSLLELGWRWAYTRVVENLTGGTDVDPLTKGLYAKLVGSIVSGLLNEGLLVDSMPPWRTITTLTANGVQPAPPPTPLLPAIPALLSCLLYSLDSDIATVLQSASEAFGKCIEPVLRSPAALLGTAMARCLMGRASAHSYWLVRAKAAEALGRFDVSLGDALESTEEPLAASRSSSSFQNSVSTLLLHLLSDEHIKVRIAAASSFPAFAGFAATGWNTRQELLAGRLRGAYEGSFSRGLSLLLREAAKVAPSMGGSESYHRYDGILRALSSLFKEASKDGSWRAGPYAGDVIMVTVEMLSGMPHYAADIQLHTEEQEPYL